MLYSKSKVCCTASIYSPLFSFDLPAHHDTRAYIIKTFLSASNLQINLEYKTTCKLKHIQHFSNLTRLLCMYMQYLYLFCFNSFLVFAQSSCCSEHFPQLVSQPPLASQQYTRTDHCQLHQPAVASYREWNSEL